jgi:AcrR family transcriptional regulator
MQYINKGKQTKEHILDAAFSFYAKPRFTNVSLSEIAVKTGITKAAIFRHFKNKEALFDAMQKRFFDDVAENILANRNASPQADSKDDPGGWRIILKHEVRLMANRADYLCYILYKFVSNPDFEAVYYAEMKERGVLLFDTDNNVILTPDGKKLIVKNISGYFCRLYIILTITFFIGHIYFDKFLNEGQPSVMTAEEFSEKLALLIENGISEETTWISPERLKELDTGCCPDMSSLPPVDPIFSALSEVIRKKGFPGTTVESIAEELGLAKSSLYTYFSNKDELIVNLVQRELFLLAREIQQKTRLATQSSETGYITMRTELEYFRIRPAVLSVIGWLRLRGSFLPDVSMYEKLGVTNEIFSRPVENTADFPLTVKTYYEWMGMLSSTYLTQSRVHGLTMEQCFEALRQCFQYIQRGIGYNRPVEQKQTTGK